MSLVGPRPEMLENVTQYTRDVPEFSYRLKVKAGLTGFAQIEGKYNTSPKDKMIMDLLYIERYSIWLDVKLMLRTLTVFFKADSTEAFGSQLFRGLPTGATITEHTDKIGRHQSAYSPSRRT